MLIDGQRPNSDEKQANLTDSLLTVSAIKNSKVTRLEVDNVIDSCRQMLHSRKDISLSKISRHTKAVHMCTVFTCPSDFLLETGYLISLE